VPVLAAGGIGTGRAMAAALAAGADGVRVGTRFVAATEAAAHPEYVAALIASQAEDTIYTTAFSRSWPDAPHRVLRSCVKAAEAFQGDTVGEMTARRHTDAGAASLNLCCRQSGDGNNRGDGPVCRRIGWCGDAGRIGGRNSAEFGR